MRRAGLLGAVVVFVLGALLVVRPFLAAQRDQAASVPSPAALAQTSTVPLERGAPVCFDDAAIDPRATEVRFNVASPEGPAPAIGVEIEGVGDGGYVFSGVAPAGTLDTAQVRLPITQPAQAEAVRVCLSNQGRQPIGLYASSDRTRSRSLAQVDGRELQQSVWFSFNESTGRTILERLPATAERITVMRPWYVGRPVVWVLIVLFGLGVPAGVVWAYLRGLRESGAEETRRMDVAQRRSWWHRLTD